MLPRQWLEPLSVPTPEAPQTLAGEGLHPLVAQVLARRGLVDAAAVRAFLDPACYVPASPFDLPGMEAAVARIGSALRRQEVIGVWGDFDVDGQTSTTLLVEALRHLGADVRYHIPVRERESHGVTIPYLSQFLDDGVQLVVTCDTGITANEAVAYARQRGVDVIITDHHSLPEQLPEALALVNPQFLAPGHPLGALPGVGVAYKLVEALYQRRGDPEACARYLDLVALGIVADVALQTGDTRYLLQRGLSALRQTQRLGLLALFEMAELSPAGLSEEHIGFMIGPRLNALGRLSDANPIVDFLTTRMPAGPGCWRCNWKA